MTIQNVVHQAVQVVGGPTCAGIALRINPQTVHQWVRKGYVPRYELAKKLAELSGFKLEELRPVVRDLVGAE